MFTDFYSFLRVDGYFFLFQRPSFGAKQDVLRDGIQWVKRNKLNSEGRVREDYSLSQSKILCIFKAQSDYMDGDVSPFLRSVVCYVDRLIHGGLLILYNYTAVGHVHSLQMALLHQSKTSPIS